MPPRRSARLIVPEEPPQSARGMGRVGMAVAGAAEIGTWARSLRQAMAQAHAQAAAARANAEKMRAALRAQQARLASYQRHRRLPSLPFLDPDFVLTSDRSTLLAAAVDAAIALIGADMGNLQLVDPVAGALQLVAQCGFGPPFLEFFAWVRDGHTACGQAWQHGTPILVGDVAGSAIFRGTPGLDVMLDAGARAVQSVPIRTASGQLLGVFSTHWRRPRSLTTPDRHLLELLARRTARGLAWRSAHPGPSCP